MFSTKTVRYIQERRTLVVLFGSIVVQDLVSLVYVLQYLESKRRQRLEVPFYLGLWAVVQNVDDRKKDSEVGFVRKDIGGGEST